MISDWLELDATDDWVRHDSEIVSFFYKYVIPRLVASHRVTEEITLVIHFIGWFLLFSVFDF